MVFRKLNVLHKQIELNKIRRLDHYVRVFLFGNESYWLVSEYKVMQITKTKMT